MLSKGLANIRHRGCLLADSDVNADHAFAALVDDGVDRDCGLTGLTVANDELALAAANGDHRIYSEKPGLNRFAHRGAVDDTGGFKLNGTTMGLAKVALAVDRLAKRIDNATEHASADGDVHNTASSTAGVAFLDRVDVAEQNGADLIAVQVLSQAVNGLSRRGTGELQQLTSHRALETEDVSDTVAHLGYMGYFLGIDGSRQVKQALPQDLFDVLGTDCLGHVAIPPNSLLHES